jgi:hypothetical protein
MVITFDPSQPTSPRCLLSPTRQAATTMATPASVAATPARPRPLGWARLPAWPRRLLVAAALVALWHLYAVHKGPLLMANALADRA